MTSQETTSTTSNREEQTARYEKTKTIKLSQEMGTAATAQILRTVATSLTGGELEVRYTPRDIMPQSGETQM